MKSLLKHIVFTLMLGAFLLTSCIDDPIDESFYPVEKLSIADYLEQNKDTLPTFYKLLDELGYLATMSAYNPNGNGYSIFLPSEQAFAEYFQKSANYTSIEQVIADDEYARSLALYHIVNIGLLTTDFPFGSLPDTTASGDFLTVAIDTITSLPRINGIASIVDPNIELINGYIHIIDEVLLPITYTTGEWIKSQAKFSIMYEALELTGLVDLINASDDYTLLLENNQVLNKNQIFSIDDLIERYSPDDVDYTSDENGLYQFLAFHLIEGIYYLDDFEGRSSLYNTATVYPLNIDGESLIMKINEGVGSLDTIISGPDTTIIDFIGFDYENSNNQAINGAVHQIDQVLNLWLPERIQVVNQFYNEPEINALRNDPGSTVFSDQENFEVLHWEGIDEITYIKSSEEISGVWNNDYIVLDGSFSLSYEIPRLLPGKYNLYVGAHAFDDGNASIRVAFDGNSIGGNIDLTSGGTSSNPYFNFLVGTIDLSEYSSHIIEVSTLIPGMFVCDRFTLEPVE